MAELNTFFFSLLAAVLFMSVIFVVAVKRNRFDIIDVAWGLVFIAIALVSYITYIPESLFTVQLIVTLLVIVWGLRLSLHIYARWSRSDKEDKRYMSYREVYAKKPGGVKGNMYLRIFLVQAVLALIVSLPVIVVNGHEPVIPTAATFLGVVIWLIGFYFEALGDYQLRKFISQPDNKGHLMTSGLWKYTRHPNYFGEMTQWWGIGIIATAAVPSLWWLAVIGPIVITILLTFISGVPLTEKHFEGRKGWDEYKRRTSKLIPLPPKK